MDDLANEARALLESVGAEGVRVEKDAQGYLVAATFKAEGFDGQPHAGHTAIDPNTSGDPRDMAARLIALSRAGAARMAEREKAAPEKPPEPQPDAYDSPEAEATEEPTFTPETDPFGPPIADESEVMENPSHEAEQVHEADAGDRPDDGDELGTGVGAVLPDDSSGALDADFTEGEDLGSELLDVELELHTPELPAPDPEDFAPEDFVQTEDQSGAFIFGDNLHQMRTAAIGLVVQAALTRLPAPTDYGKLSELRNFAMGVSENRWPDDPAKRDELDAMEAIERRRRQIEAARDEKVAFLASEETTREQIEAFDPEAGWPQ